MVVAPHVTGERMSRRKYRVKWRKIADVDQKMKRTSGNMKKILEMTKKEYQNREKGM